MSKTGEVPTVSKTVMMPDPLNGEARSKEKRVSIASSTLSDATTENGDVADFNRSLKKTKLQRRRKRLSVLLHTHVVLIIVCTLSALDAICVIGQIICDILIMKENLEKWNKLDSNLTSLLWIELPSVLNTSDHQSADSLDLQTIADILWQHQQHGSQPNLISALFSQLVTSGVIENSEGELLKEGLLKIPAGGAAHSRRKRAAGGGEDDDGGHSTLYHLTHAFHLGSMIILSALLLECFLKVFAMGKKLLHHKLEMFDIFVVSVSWSLDVAFWEGIWAHPESEAATILIVMLPWRVIRIVNSFVLVIQEKDHVELKIIKQRLRLSIKKGKELLGKASSYKSEAKQLQELCRKCGATESELISCIPADRRSRRRRSSQKPSMAHSDSSISLTASTLNVFASLDTTPDSSSDEDDVKTTARNGRHLPSLQSATSVSTLDDVFVDDGRGHSQGQGQLPTGVDNPAFNDGASSSTSQINGVGNVTVSRQDSLTRL